MKTLGRYAAVVVVLLFSVVAWAAGAVVDDVTVVDLSADYLVVAPAAAAKDLKPLMDYRTGQGRTVRLLPSETIYAAYGDGKPSAEALNKCLVAWRDAPDRKRPVAFVLLAGSPESKSLPVPTKIVDARFDKGTWGFPVSTKLASDLALVGPSARRRPVPAVGRLPARTLDQLKTMVRKTVDYEKNLRPGPWRRQVEITAGQGGFGAALDGILENIFAVMMRDSVPPFYDVTVSYAKPDSPYGYVPSEYNRRLVEAMNSGPALTVYVGHGAERSFDSLHWKGKSYPLLSLDDLDRLKAPHQRGLVVALACWTGRTDTARASIGEALLAEPGGPAAFLGASRISQPYANAVLALSLVRNVLDDPAPTVGEAVVSSYRHLAADADKDSELRKLMDAVAAAQIGLRESGQQIHDQPYMYNLLGDPALTLPAVRKRMTVEAKLVAADGARIGVTVKAPFKRGRLVFTVTAPRDTIVHPLPGVNLAAADGRARMIERHRLANDKVLLRHDALLIDGGASWVARLPAGVTAQRVHVNVYGWSETEDAAGSATVERPKAD